MSWNLDRLNCGFRLRLFTVPLFFREIVDVEFDNNNNNNNNSNIYFALQYKFYGDGLPSWALDASETGQSTICPWVELVRLIAWGWKSGKNRETNSFSLSRRSLLQQQQHLIGLRHNRNHQSITDYWQLEWRKVTSLRGSGQNGIDFRWNGKCFHFNRLSASCLESCLVHRNIFRLVAPIQHQDVFSKDLLGEFVNSSPFRDLR